MNFAAKAVQHPYVPLYRTGTVCPGCGGGKWLLGRFSVECAGCGVAMMFAPAEKKPTATLDAPRWADRP